VRRFSAASKSFIFRYHEPALQFAENPPQRYVRVVRRFSGASKPFYSCHHEPASAGEGPAFPSFSANCLGGEGPALLSFSAAC
jgi:hypothetical protein